MPLILPCPLPSSIHAMPANSMLFWQGESVFCSCISFICCKDLLSSLSHHSSLQVRLNERWMPSTRRMTRTCRTTCGDWISWKRPLAKLDIRTQNLALVSFVNILLCLLSILVQYFGWIWVPAYLCEQRWSKYCNLAIICLFWDHDCYC